MGTEDSTDFKKMAYQLTLLAEIQMGLGKLNFAAHERVKWSADLPTASEIEKHLRWTATLAYQEAIQDVMEILKNIRERVAPC